MGRLGGVADEPFHLQLTELAGVAPREAATEAFDSRDADDTVARRNDGRLALEHLDPGGREALAHPLGLTGMVIVVAEHGDDRDLDD